MASVFWGARGIIFIDYLQKGKTINGEYYANLLQRLSDEIKKKRPHFGEKESVVSSRQCTSSHIRYRDGQNQWVKVRIVPSDYFLFPNLKKWLSGKRFANNEEVESADGYFEDLDSSYYKQGVEAIEHCCEKCIELKGNYVEK